MAVLTTDDVLVWSLAGRSAHMHGVVCEPQAGLRPRIVVKQVCEQQATRLQHPGACLQKCRPCTMRTCSTQLEVLSFVQAGHTSQCVQSRT